MLRCRVSSRRGDVDHYVPTAPRLTHLSQTEALACSWRRVLPSDDVDCGVDIQTARSDCTFDERLNFASVTDKNTTDDDDLIRVGCRR